MAGSRWARVDTTYLSNPKIRALPDSIDVLLHLASILHAAHHLTDGYLSADALAGLSLDARAGARRVPQRVDRQVDAGLWLPVGAGFRLHDFEEMNPQAMREVVEAERKRARERQRAWRDRRNAVTEEDLTP